MNATKTYAAARAAHRAAAVASNKIHTARYDTRDAYDAATRAAHARYIAARDDWDEARSARLFS